MQWIATLVFMSVVYTRVPFFLPYVLVIADTTLGAVTSFICLHSIRLPTRAHPAYVHVCIQEFHYQPRGSDTCLPCDCYPVGSFSRSCDPETGQCPCRPGVIGRQCNTCDNPFAEVTNSGCEGQLFYFLFFFRHFGPTFRNCVSLCCI